MLMSPRYLQYMLSFASVFMCFLLLCGYCGKKNHMHLPGFVGLVSCSRVQCSLSLSPVSHVPISIFFPVQVSSLHVLVFVAMVIGLPVLFPQSLALFSVLSFLPVWLIPAVFPQVSCPYPRAPCLPCYSQSVPSFRFCFPVWCTSL